MKATIRKDGIYHSFNARLRYVLLCKLGFHAWYYFHMAISFIKMLPKEANVSRRCDRCGWMECTVNGRDWQGRV